MNLTITPGTWTVFPEKMDEWAENMANKATAVYYKRINSALSICAVLIYRL